MDHGPSHPKYNLKSKSITAPKVTEFNFGAFINKSRLSLNGQSANATLDAVSESHFSTAFIDDILILNAGKDLLLEHMALLVTLLESLGFLTKSHTFSQLRDWNFSKLCVSTPGDSEVPEGLGTLLTLLHTSYLEVSLIPMLTPSPAPTD